MIKPIVRDTFFLSQKSDEATKADLPIAQDLVDTLKLIGIIVSAWLQT